MAIGISPILNWARNNARIEKSYVREIIAEFLATFTLCLFAVGGTMNINASINSVGSPIRFVSSPTSSVWPVAFGYFLATLLFGGVSGSHVNPAISIGMAIAGRLSWVKLHAFILVQILGGYLGSLFAYAMFKSYFDSLTTGDWTNNPASAAIFNSTPGYISLGSGFFNEIVLTCLFMMAFLAVNDMWNSRSPRYVQGILIGLVVIGLGLSFGDTTGVAINPARDICPRLAALSLGWDSNIVMKSPSPRDEQWWSVGFFAPFIGAIVGSFLYIFVIGAQLRYNDGEDSGDVVTIEASPMGMGMGMGGVEPQERWKANVFVPRVPFGKKQQGQPQMPPQMSYQQHPNQMPVMTPYSRVQFRQ